MGHLLFWVGGMFKFKVLKNLQQRGLHETRPTGDCRITDPIVADTIWETQFVNMTGKGLKPPNNIHQQECDQL